MIQFDEDKQNKKLNDLLKKEEEELVQALSAKYNIEYINLATTNITTDALRLIDEPAAREAKIAAFSMTDKKIKVAVRNPDDPKAVEIVEGLKSKGYIPTLYITSTTDLEKAWTNYKDLSFAMESKAGTLDISSDEISALIEKAKGLPTVVSILQNTMTLKKSYRISRILETIIAGALGTGASDIHLEPEEEFVRIRYRLDGVLVEVITFDKETYNLVLSRIKLLSGLKLNIKKDSQDGRFSVNIGDSAIEIRTSVLPGAYNESVVMRILNPKSINVPLEALGIPDKLLKILLRTIDLPNGMILTTGPTGSGKTTTLYAFLKKVKDPGIKIITIEDPIEYHLPGIVQTQTNDKGYTFLEGLRAAVRQDPDIIMVGEIRDNETASIAINSALTGHLVFSTLHTNDAAGTFPRLVDLGINPKILTSALTIALAQRLVRKLCEFCKKEVDVDEKTKKIVEDTLATIYDKSEIPSQNGQAPGIISKIWQSVGCEKCNHTGYKGRIGVYEGILVNDPAIEKVIDYGSSDREIAEAAAPQGILTMKQDGMIKVFKGISSVDELRRVIEIDTPIGQEGKAEPVVIKEVPVAETAAITETAPAI
jgi:type IV pilus assembly protein PilB